LLSKAIDALARGGIGTTSVSDLVVQVGIAKGSFYTFYPSKEHLFMDALELVEAKYRDIFVSGLDDPGNPQEKLMSILHSALDMIENEPALRFIDGSVVERLSRALPPERIEEHRQADNKAAQVLLETWKAKSLVKSELNAEELAGIMYIVFLLGSGLRSLPPTFRNTTRNIFVEAMAHQITKGSDAGNTEEIVP